MKVIESFFEPGTSVTIARSPGRLDVMGGIADYSGSLVLQRPIAEGTFAAVQQIDEPSLEITSIGRDPITVPLRALTSYATARKLFSAPEHHWAAYVAGIFTVLIVERGVTFSNGARIVIASDVPEGKGVSSSAALETSTMQAVVEEFGLLIPPYDMAILCQKAENLVAGAPCGVMDQMTCVFGEENALLALLCQPAELQAPVVIPSDIAFWGLDSGERHVVSGADYASVRTGAFMGRQMLDWNDHLANITTEEFESDFVDRLPEEISGDEFLRRYLRTADDVTRVDPQRIYKIHQPTAHPIYEHDRVKAFRQLLLEPSSEERRTSLGALMYASHASYSACGLGSRGTDLLVQLVRAAGPEKGLFGARITGGGSGGTVAVLGSHDAYPAILQVAGEYEHATCYRPYIFAGSSRGVLQFGSKRLGEIE
jgi:L-arabinokinase